MSGTAREIDIYPYYSDLVLGVGSTDIQFPTLSGPLFPENGLHPSDIKQGALGECFFDAALLAIIQQNPYWLRHILQQTEDGRVIARVFVPNADGELKAHYISLDYTDFQPADETQNLFHRHANYVVMLEKAYAAACQLADKGAKKPLTEYLSGGQPAHVMKTFCGEQSTVLNIFAEGSKNSFIRSAYKAFLQKNFMCNVDELLETLQKIKGVVTVLLADPDADIGEVLKKQKFCDSEAIFQLDLKEFFKDKQNRDENTLMDFVRSLPKLMFAVSENAGISDATLHKKFPLSQLARLAKVLNENQHDFDTAVFEQCADYTLDLTRQYTQVELEIFQQIDEGLQNQQQVTFSTDPSLKGDQSEGHAGESLSNGLVARHAYGVVGAFQAEDGKKYVRIRNPWGTTGSQYIDRDINGVIQRRAHNEGAVGLVYAVSPDTPESVFTSVGESNPSNGDSVIELSDFIHNGATITLSSPPLPYDLVVENLIRSFSYFSKHLANGALKESATTLLELVSSDLVVFRAIFDQLKNIINAEPEATPLSSPLIKLANELCEAYDEDSLSLSDETLLTMNRIISHWGMAISNIGGDNASDIVTLLLRQDDDELHALLRQEENPLFQLMLAYTYLSARTGLSFEDNALLKKIDRAITYENLLLIGQFELGLLSKTQYDKKGEGMTFAVHVKDALSSNHDLIRIEHARYVKDSTPDQLEAFDLMWQQQGVSLTQSLIKGFQSGQRPSVLDLEAQFRQKRHLMPAPTHFPAIKDHRLIALIKRHPYAAAALISGALMTALGVALVCGGVTSPVGLLFIAAGLKTTALVAATITATTAISMAVTVGGVAAVKKIAGSHKEPATMVEKTALLRDRHRLFPESAADASDCDESQDHAAALVPG